MLFQEVVQTPNYPGLNVVVAMLICYYEAQIRMESADRSVRPSCLPSLTNSGGNQAGLLLYKAERRVEWREQLGEKLIGEELDRPEGAKH